MAHAWENPRRERRGGARVVALDGLRALAVILVIAYHAGQVRFGWIGVPVFFVLSGHFITRILVEKTEGSRRTRAWNFLRNRALRLAPLYYLACLALTALAIGGHGPTPLRRDLPFLWTWTYDLRALFPSYSDNSLYDHTWSLGVEVQLYLVWTVLVLTLSRKWLVRAVLALVVAGPVIRALVWLILLAAGFSHPARLNLTYSMPTSYLDAFGIGACTALPEIRAMLGAPRRWLAGTAAVAVLCGLFETISWDRLHGRWPGDLGYPSEFPDHYGWIWGYSVVALLAGAIVLVVREGNRAAAVLSFPPLVRLGVVSYGVYLLHRPLLRIVQEHVTHWRSPWTRIAVFGTILAIGITYLAAEMSFRAVETPFMARKRGSLLGTPAQPEVPLPAAPLADELS